jgi:hypothetical protein
MNINEEAKYYSSRAAARRALEQEINAGNDRVAVGMWQIYLKFNGHYVDDPLDLIDPVTNLFVAAKVLRDCGNKYSSTRDVLSCYYSGDVDEAGIKYAERVIEKAHKWGKPYRFRNMPPEVLYTHRNVAPLSIATDKRVIAIDRYEKNEINTGTLSMATLALATSQETPTHSELMNTLSDPASTYVQRVIVVE